jgi:signal transduction histidine kinase
MVLEGIPQNGHAVMPKTEAIAEASMLIGRAIQQVRSISHLLHPPLLDEVGLQSALQWYLEGFTKRSGIETSIEVQPQEFPRLAPELETTIFRIVQEALTNVFRHSGAQRAWVTLSHQESQAVSSVRDNGKGISSGIQEFSPGLIGVGLSGMKRRVKELGGELRLLNAEPGTIVEVSIPTDSVTAVTLAEEFSQN